ncbi:MAG: pilus assembly protein N-terminal domain-containing protein [Thermoguttaceae bacterium]
MNQRPISVAQRPITVAFLLLGQLAMTSLFAHGQQPPVVIPPGTASPTGAAAQPSSTAGQTTDSSPAGPYYKVTGLDDHLKMVVNSSRFLTLDKKIPQVQVNNPDVLDVAPMSPNMVQVSAKRTGVTQVNLWGEDKRIYTVTVLVTADAAELAAVLRQLFPRSSLTIVPVSGNSAIISGYVDQQEAVPKIVSIAIKYFPEVINNMKVSGVQQAILHVKLYEVSRTKLRNMGFDWAVASDNGKLIMSGVSGLLTTAAPGSPGTFGVPTNAPDAAFKVNLAGANAFTAVLGAMRQDNLAKLDAEPDLVTTSGRPAYMISGGSIGYQVSSTVAGNTVGWMTYGTRLDFLPIVLGNGRMRIDVRANVSESDPTNSIDGIPAFKSREVETGVELRAGQTLAIAGLLQQQVEASNTGLPWISEIPYLGVPFRSVSHSTNEVELIVLVTPEIVDGMEPGQVPTCLPGTQTANPSDWELFFKGHLEVPNCCPDPAVCRNPVITCTSGGANPGESPISRQDLQNRSTANQMVMNPQPAEPDFIGPVGYDILK